MSEPSEFGASPADPKSRKVCPSCGAKVPAAKFCSECGAQLPAAPSLCRECGAQLAPKAKFCGECGAPTAAAATQPSPSLRPAARIDPPPAPAAPPPGAVAAAAVAASPATEFRFRLKHAVGPRNRIFGVDKDQVRAFAAALRVARDNALLPEPVVNALHQSLRFGSGAGVHTVGLGSLAWSRLENGAWRPAEAPDFLWIDSTTLAQANAAGRAHQPVIDVALAAMAPGGHV